MNFYRATASLPPVAEDTRLSGAVLQHARYMVMHDIVQHSENPRDSWATAEGAEAAAVSNLAGSNLAESDAWAVDTWMQAPFHALGILDPALRHVGFGIQRADHGHILTAAGLDVIRGRDAGTQAAPYPIVWPANGVTVPIGSHTAESPSPLTSCPGYTAPSGLPLIVQMGPDNTLPRVTGSWISMDGRLLEHCVFTARTYRNRDSAEERVGRSILAAHDAIVLVPREPLRRGSSYRATLEVNGRMIDWTFSVGAGL